MKEKLNEFEKLFNETLDASCLFDNVEPYKLEYKHWEAYADYLVLKNELDKLQIPLQKEIKETYFKKFDKLEDLQPGYIGYNDNLDPLVLYMGDNQWLDLQHNLYSKNMFERSEFDDNETLWSRNHYATEINLEDTIFYWFKGDTTWPEYQNVEKYINQLIPDVDLYRKESAMYLLDKAINDKATIEDIAEVLRQFLQIKNCLKEDKKKQKYTLTHAGYEGLLYVDRAEWVITRAIGSEVDWKDLFIL